MTAPTSDDGALDLRWEKTVGQFADLAALFADIRLSLSQTKAAEALGLPNADALRRRLLKRRLPPYRLLRDWYYVSLMVERAMANDRPGHWAMERGEFANVYYRFVETLTGLRWPRSRHWRRPEVRRQLVHSVGTPTHANTAVGCCTVRSTALGSTDHMHAVLTRTNAVT